MGLSVEERAILEERLVDAESALHRLMTGQAARVVVDQNTERVEFAVANADRLRAYIWELKMTLGKVRASGPMKPWML
jgi:hypothetical protein